MKRLTREEFDTRFPSRKPVEELTGILNDPVRIERDTAIVGRVEGPLLIDAGAQVVVMGVAEGPITVGPGAVLRCEPGLVESSITLHGGAALLSATVGRVRGDAGSVIHDPCGPADSETG